jgi:hypothetical protein
MYFHLGPPPTPSGDPPQTTGWIALREPRPWTLVIVGSALGIPICFGLIWLWQWLAPAPPLRFDLGFLGSRSPMAGLFVLLLVPFVFLTALFAAHELLHAFACPGLGLTARTVVGAWPARMMFYAGHLDPVTCRRYVVICAMPFLVLTLLPWVICWATHSNALLLRTFSVANALFCGGDLVVVAVVLRQVPWTGRVYNHGYSTYWKPPGTTT